MACLQSCRQAFENVRLARTILANKDVYPFGEIKPGICKACKIS